MNRRIATITIISGCAAIAPVVALPAGTATATGPMPQDLLCSLLGTCPTTPDPAPGDDIVVVIDPINVGSTLGDIIDTTVATVDTVLPGTAAALDNLPVGQLPQPVGAVLDGVTSGHAGPTLDVVVETAQAGVNGVLGEATDAVDSTLNQIGLGSVVAADVRVPVDLTDGVVVSPTATASVDLGGATAPLPASLTDLVDADVAVNLCGVNVVVLTSHNQNCSGTGPAAATISNPLLADVKLPVDVCGVQVVVLASSTVDCSESGGNQSGGATGALSDALASVTAAIGLCGVQVGVLSSAHTDCSGRPTGLDTGVCVAGSTCLDVIGVDSLCGISVAVPNDVSVTCTTAATPGPGTPTPGTPGGPGRPNPGTPGAPASPGAPGTDDTPQGGGTGTAGTPADATGDGTGDGTGPVGTPGAGPIGGHSGVFTSLPTTGLSIVSLVIAGCGLLATGLTARRARGFAAVR
ncbi:MAG TPA: hypothetical protein VNQ73_00565 [Ilumatobacter sp.]|nr:hypothetical protein [Ilumatobacter sp.]